MTLPKLAGADSDDPAQGLQAVVVLRRMTDRLEAIQSKPPGPTVGPGNRSAMLSACHARRPTRNTGGRSVRAIHQGSQACGDPRRRGGRSRGDSRVGTEHLLIGWLARPLIEVCFRTSKSFDSSSTVWIGTPSSRSGWIRH